MFNRRCGQLNAFKAKLPTLLREYGKKYVAMRQGQIVDVDADEVALATRVCREYPDDYVLVRQVTSSGEAKSYIGIRLGGSISGRICTRKFGGRQLAHPAIVIPGVIVWHPGGGHQTAGKSSECTGAERASWPNTLRKA